MTCRYNLHTDIAPKASRKRTFYLRVLREYDAEGDYPSCALDVADSGGALQAEIAKIYGMTHQGIQLIKAGAFHHARLPK